MGGCTKVDISTIGHTVTGITRNPVFNFSDAIIASGHSIQQDI